MPSKEHITFGLAAILQCLVCWKRLSSLCSYCLVLIIPPTAPVMQTFSRRVSHTLLTDEELSPLLSFHPTLLCAVCCFVVRSAALWLARNVCIGEKGRGRECTYAHEPWVCCICAPLSTVRVCACCCDEILPLLRERERQRKLGMHCRLQCRGPGGADWRERREEAETQSKVSNGAK